MSKIIKIGGASGFLYDSVTSVEQLLQVEDINYIVFDYLGEGTMGHLGMMSKAMAGGGFANDFIDIHIMPSLPVLMARGIKVVANAGGINPKACAQAMRKAAAAKGLMPRVAYIEGDDLRPRIEELRQHGYRNMFDNSAFPEAIESINAYLGAFPIANALSRGADIVIVGREVDSGVTLGPLIYEFGWSADDHGLLAAGSLVGHLIECGNQVTGGTYTDWRQVPDWANMSFPVAECHADGSAVITKPESTGGCVIEGTVIEQMLYEVSDPQAYFLPDVTCDFSQVKVAQLGKDRVSVSGARGYAPTQTYKVCATYHRGWRCTVVHPIVALEAVARAERQAAAIFKHAGQLLEKRQLGDWLGTHVDIIGSEKSFGPRARARTRQCREVMCRMVVEHRDKAAVDLFGRESYAAMTAMSVGTLMPISPVVIPVLLVFSFLLEKSRVPVSVTVGEETLELPLATGGGFSPEQILRPRPPAPRQLSHAFTAVPLLALAIGRSGDKGNLFNVAVIARRPEYLPYINGALTPERIADWYGHLFDNPQQRRVDRYDVPGVHAINFVVHECLAGGIMGSMRIDAAAKGMAQLLMEYPVPVPNTLLSQLDPDHLCLGTGASYDAEP